jgi:hypothetical protein
VAWIWPSLKISGLIFEGIVNGTSDVPNLVGLNLDQEQGSAQSKLEAIINDSLLQMAIFDLITAMMRSHADARGTQWCVIEHEPTSSHDAEDITWAEVPFLRTGAFGVTAPAQDLDRLVPGPVPAQIEAPPPEVGMSSSRHIRCAPGPGWAGPRARRSCCPPLRGVAFYPSDAAAEAGHTRARVSRYHGVPLLDPVAVADVCFAVPPCFRFPARV